jgi:5S rRNA maturation endonuclease (ribonuclease M5)
LSTHLKEKEEKIQQILERLAEEASKGTLIIVEGKKDIEALKALSIDANVIAAKTGGKSLLDVISEVEKTDARKVILLLDFDRRGKELTRTLITHLEKTGIRLNLRFWHDLFNLVSSEVKDVEGLASYMETLKRKTSNS